MPESTIRANALYGLDETHLVSFEEVKINPCAQAAFEQLRDAACDAGFNVGFVSAFRSFDRQLAIWNGKALGVRPILDDKGNPLAREDLTDAEAVFAILRWSALPGASRHHWGTDIDIVDAGAITPGYQVQLTVEETCGNGIFAPFHKWLTGYLKTQKPLFKPYGLECSTGIACEPWHLSFAPEAAKFQKTLNKHELIAQLQAADLALKDVVFQHIDEIFERFVWVDWSLYPEEFRLC